MVQFLGIIEEAFSYSTNDGVNTSNTAHLFITLAPVIPNNFSTNNDIILVGNGFDLYKIHTYSLTDFWPNDPQA